MNLPHKRAATAWRVVREVESHLALGPQGEVLVDYLDALRDLTEDEIEAVDVALYAAHLGAQVDAHAGAWAAARAARCAAWYAVQPTQIVTRAARYAALALVVADLVGREHLDILTGPARTIPRLSKIIDRALTGNEEISS